MSGKKKTKHALALTVERYWLVLQMLAKHELILL